MKKIIKFWMTIIMFPFLTNALDIPEVTKLLKEEGHTFMLSPIIDPTTGPTRDSTGYGLGLTWFYIGYGDQISSKSFYLHRLSVDALWRKRGLHNYSISWEAPYLAYTNFTLTSKLSYKYNKFATFWGSNYSDQSYLRGPVGSSIEGKKLNLEDYHGEIIKKTNYKFRHYNFYESKIPTFETFLEYELPFNLKPLFGIQISYIIINDFADITIHDSVKKRGNNHRDRNYVTLLNQQKNNIIGYNGGSANSFTIGGSWDTRDSQIDPLWGCLSELTFELFPRVINKQTGFAKMTLSQSVFLSPIKWTTFASRLIYGHASQKTPFWSLSEIPIGKETISGLGGNDSLRGYTNKRFVAPIQMLGNFELRLRMPTFRIWILPMSLIITPFFDVGRVFDEFYDISFKNWKFNYGGTLGFRVTSLILSLGLAYSEEDYNRFLLGFSHMF